MNSSSKSKFGAVANASVFICHTGLDGAYVAKLASRLEHDGIKCWYYERDNFGTSIGKAVDDALDECDCLLFVMSKNLPEASLYVQNELNDYVRTRRKIIPLRVSMPDKWWPKGVRSLIGSFPVIEDSSGATDSWIVDEIKRRINKSGDAKGCNMPLVHKRNRRSQLLRRIGLGIVNVAVAAAIATVVFVVARNEATANVRDERISFDGGISERTVGDIQGLLDRKKSEMTQKAIEEWNSALERIDAAERNLDNLEKEMKEFDDQIQSRYNEHPQSMREESRRNK